jgi:L-amino acid N-acyltransferase YncA
VIGERLSLRVDALVAGDWPRVSAIFADGIATGHATFETEVPSWDAWNAAHLRSPRLVARTADGVVGWAACTPYSSRAAYAGVAEESVYVAHGARGQGVGRALLGTLVERAEQAGIWTLQAGIFPENMGSLRLRLGRLDGAWRDVVLLERRSKEIR